MGPMDRSTVDEFDSALVRARESFPEYDFYRVVGGYVMVPAGTPVITGMSIDSVLAQMLLGGHE